MGTFRKSSRHRNSLAGRLIGPLADAWAFFSTSTRPRRRGPLSRNSLLEPLEERRLLVATADVELDDDTGVSASDLLTNNATLAGAANDLGERGSQVAIPPAGIALGTRPHPFIDHVYRAFGGQVEGFGQDQPQF